MNSTDIAYYRLCAAVCCAGIKIWQERADAYLAQFDTRA